MPMYDYKCVEGHVTREFRYLQDVRTAGHCPICEGLTWLEVGKAVPGNDTGEYNGKG